MSRGADCKGCPLYGQERLVDSEIRPGAKLLVVAEAPGKQEVLDGAPLVGPSGQVFAAGLAAAGWSREQVSITNSILCQPPPGVSLDDYLRDLNRLNRRAAAREGTAAGLAPSRLLRSPVECCAPRLEKDIEESEATTYLALGSKALQSIARIYKIPYGGAPDENGLLIDTLGNQAGAPVKLPDGKHLVASWHPAFGLRDSKHMLSFIRKIITRACHIAERQRINWAWAPTILEPTFEQCVAFLRALRSNKYPVVCDIETDGIDVRKTLIRCIGFGTSVLRNGKLAPDSKFVVLSVPLVRRDGTHYWNPEQRAQLTTEFQQTFDELEFIFHNGAFDTAVLMAHGYWRQPKKLWHDTMIAHHCTRWNDYRHGLGVLGRQYTEAPLWKKEVDHKSAVGDSSDAVLRRYNCNDVQVTNEAAKNVFLEVIRDDTTAAYKRDCLKARITRDMTVRGLWIDEAERGRLSVAYNNLETTFAQAFVDAVGRPINPNSRVQIAEWLYGEQRLTPPLNTEGEDFEEGDDPAVSIGALFQLQDQGLDPRTDRAVKYLLNYRAVQKARSVYVDHLPVQYPDEVSDQPMLPACPIRTWEYKKATKTKAASFLQRPDVSLQSRRALGRIYPTWHVHVVPSGRWSSSDPAVQNWPEKIWAIDGAAQNSRTLITVPPGHVMVGADYEQLELRILAAICGDKLSILAIEKKLDPHLLAAALVTAEAGDEATVMARYYELKNWKEHGDVRQQAYVKFVRGASKTIRYLKNYGGGGDKLYESMRTLRDKSTNDRVFEGLDRKVIAEWEKRWDARQDAVKKWQRSTALFVNRHGYTESPVGVKRRRYFPDGPSKENAPGNHIIQATGADYADEAVEMLDERIPFGSWSKWTGIYMQIHDDIKLCVPESRAEEASKILEECMYKEMKCEWGVMPFPAKAVVSRNWADNK